MVDNSRFTLSKFFGLGYYSVSDFESSRLWDSVQIRRFLDDISKAAEYFEQTEKYRFVDIGIIKVYAVKYNGVAEIIDGKQRLLVLSLVLSALFAWFENGHGGIEEDAYDLFLYSGDRTRLQLNEPINSFYYNLLLNGKSVNAPVDSFLSSWLYDVCLIAGEYVENLSLQMRHLVTGFITELTIFDVEYVDC